MVAPVVPVVAPPKTWQKAAVDIIERVVGAFCVAAGAAWTASGFGVGVVNHTDALQKIAIAGIAAAIAVLSGMVKAAIGPDKSTASLLPTILSWMTRFQKSMAE